ncbi:electron transport complex subunit E [bacterium]|nr:electron transport complex subunit E [bacterium]
MDKKQFKNIAISGLLKDNPTLRLVLGTCPTLALSTSAMNGIGMGAAVIFILICSNVLISLLRKVIPDAVRIPAFVLIIATFVTIVRMVMEKYLPDLYQSLGVYLPLIVVNCIILGRAESFASKNTVLSSAFDGLFNGLGFALALTVMGIIREILGSGAVFGIFLWQFKIEFFTSAAGAFFVYGIMIALFNAIYTKAESISRQKNFAKNLLPLPAAQNTQMTEVK